MLVLAAALGWRRASWRGRLVALGGHGDHRRLPARGAPRLRLLEALDLRPLLPGAAGRADLAARFRRHSGTWRVVSAIGAGVVAVLVWSPTLCSKPTELIDFYPNLESVAGGDRAPAIAGSALVLTDDTALRYYLYPAHGDGPRHRARSSSPISRQDGLDAYRQRHRRPLLRRHRARRRRDAPGQRDSQSARPDHRQTLPARVLAARRRGFTVEVFKPVRPTGVGGAEDTQLNWPVAYTFDAGQRRLGRPPRRRATGRPGCRSPRPTSRPGTAIRHCSSRRRRTRRR